MRRFIASSLMALVVAGSVGRAVADGECETIKTDTSAFTDLSSRASSAKLDLGKRAGVAPDVTETIDMAPQKLSPKQVQTVVAKKLDEVQYCYERAMIGIKSPTSEVGVTFVILPRGNVGKVDVQVSGPHGKSLEKCITQRVKKWRFPVAEGETEVTIPFELGMAGQSVD